MSIKQNRLKKNRLENFAIKSFIEINKKTLFPLLVMMVTLVNEGSQRVTPDEEHFITDMKNFKNQNNKPTWEINRIFYGTL